MSQDPEEPPIVFRQVTPEEFCAAYHRAVAEGGDSRRPPGRWPARATPMDAEELCPDCGDLLPVCECLIVSESSRLGRDTIRVLALIQAIQDSGVSVYGYLDDKEITVSDETGEVEQFMRSWASSQERRKASQRTRDALKLRAERGQHVGGKLFGYAKGAIVPAERDIIRRIFMRRAEGAGYFTIARELARDGPRPPRSHVWNQSQIASIVSNETYAGVRVWGRTR